jgi:DNA repair protein SbcC/Rad50
MIPIRLRISGFLSYHDPVELDFTGFDLACISGQNGAGKSSLLDAITWALFGQARRRDEALINLQSKAAEVTLIFQYEGAIYRIQRALPRGKSGILEFQRLETEKTPAVPVAAGAAPNRESPQPEYRLPEHPSWRPLTERTVRETQLCIEETLRLDYDTFVNAAFFLQGKADQFTQQTANKRKDVLGSILGLEVWEQYKARAGDKRKRFEDDLTLLERRIVEIDTELGEDQARKQRLAELETDLKQLSLARKSQAVALESIKHTAASLAQQRKLVAALAASVHRSRVQLDTLCSRLAERQLILSADSELIGRAAEIQANYHLWRQTVAELEEWDKVAFAFREHDKERAPLLQKIAGEKARLEEEQRSLALREQDVKNQQATIGDLQSQIEAAEELLLILEAKVGERAALEERRAAARETQVRLQAENEALRPEMAALRQRIDTLESAEGAACPLCGQPLSPEHRESTLEQLRAEGTEKGDRFRANKVLMDETTAAQREVQSGLDGLSTAEVERLACSNSLAQLRERIQSLQKAEVEWGSQGRKRLKELAHILKDEKYALDAQKELAKVNKYLAGLGYEAAAHDATRTAEQAQRPADEDYRKLESARAALAPLESEITNLKSEVANREAEIATQEAEYQIAQTSLELAESEAPDLDAAERTLYELSEQENRLNQEVGAARQKVSVLEDLRARKVGYTAERESLALQISHHKALERAFGKDGVPALLIEQALPQIESKANELLDRLSDGQMSVRFVTQAGYKDKKREDLRETLEIQISDGAGLRDYEMYSGGEAFRVDFAIRLALSEVLAQRKGARLQTLVIDEGFGSQDVQGRQRLIEAINLVKEDFAKILVITHLDELKDAFPTRIEVEKTPQGSSLAVI